MIADQIINKGHVRAAVFGTGTKRKRYYTRCAPAKIGDLVQATGWSGPATVVAYGHPAELDPPTSRARIIARATTTTDSIHATPSDWATDTLNQENPMTKKTDTPLEAAENRKAEAAAEIKRLKKQAKREARLAREREAIIQQRAQRKELALTVLEDIVASTTASNSSRIEAATKLFELA